MSKILVTDNSTFTRRLLIGALKKVGYEEVLEAKSGAEALEIIDAGGIDLVLLDVIMPDMNGIDVLKKIGSTQKVIIVTAVGQEEITKKAKELGALGYIIKPFESKKVVEEVKKALG